MNGKTICGLVCVALVGVGLIGCRNGRRGGVKATLDKVHDETRGETRELVFDIVLTNSLDQARQVHVFLQATSSRDKDLSAVWPARAEEGNLTEKGKLKIKHFDAGHAVTLPARDKLRIANKSLLLPVEGAAYDRYRILVYDMGGGLLCDETITAEVR
ncbi:MAG: hypothetical protein ACLFV7_10760 [Phycisphaerae bacterium]